jgi:site-specific DNA recombinase
MAPTHTRKGGKLYQYYITAKVLWFGSSTCPTRRIPAAQIEATVIAQIQKMVQSPEIIIAHGALPNPINGLTERQVRDELHRFEGIWWELFPAEQARLVQLLVDRVNGSIRRPLRCEFW